MYLWRTGDVKHVVLSFNIFLFLLGCSTPPTPFEVSSNILTTNNTQSININSEQLDSVILEGSNYIRNNVILNSKIGVINIQSSSENLSNYIVNSIVMHLINTDMFIIVERSEIGIIQREQQYQLSGEVSDSTAISIGQQLGVQYIVTGSILPLGDNYSFGLKILNIQTAQIMGQRMYTIKPDNVLLSLVNPSQKTEVSNKQINETQPQQVIMGDVNIINNSNTTIHGDVYINRPNWIGIE